MWIELISAGILIADYVYHRIVDEDPTGPAPITEFRIPIVSEGTTIPLIFGKCRIRQPLLVWAGPPSSVLAASTHMESIAGQPLYMMGMFFVAGIPIEGGVARLHRFWVGDVELQRIDQSVGSGLNIELKDQTGNGGLDIHFSYYGTRVFAAPNDPSLSTDVTNRFVQGTIEFLNGKATQFLVDPTLGNTPVTRAAQNMIANGVPANAIPGYRGYACVGLYNARANGVNEPNTQWCVGTAPQPDAYSFEMSSYGLDTSTKVGNDLNPTIAIRELLTGKRGKLGVSASLIDSASFEACRATLLAEGHGYSRAIESGADAREVIGEIEKQVDGVLFEDESTGKWKFKLIRADYNPNAIARIDPSNCEDLTGLAFGGRTNLINQVRVVYTDSNQRYDDNSVTAQNQAGAVGQDGIVREVVLKYPGVSNAVLAQKIAARELSARSRPLAKCRALLDRSKIRVLPGDPVLVNWPESNVSNMLMRVARVSRGSAVSGKIAVDLIQEVFYVSRDVLVGGEGTLDAHPSAG